MVKDFVIVNGCNDAYKITNCILPNSCGMGPPRLGFPTKILQVAKHYINFLLNWNTSKKIQLALLTLQKIMVFLTKNFGKKTPPYGFLLHVQLDQSVILDKLFRT